MSVDADVIAEGMPDGRGARGPLWFLGPWLIRPGLTTGVMMIFAAAVQSGASGTRGLVGNVPGLALTLVSIAVPGYLVLWLIRRWQDRHGVTWGPYLLALLIIPLIGMGARRLGLLPVLPEDSVLVGLGYFRSWVAFTIVLTLIGVAFDAVDRQVNATASALAIAREQQVQILRADEEARRQVALMLHDRVQAALLTMCLQVRDVARRMPAAENGELGSIASQLETLRAMDVRRAARVLSPNLDDVDLQTALEDVAAQYEATFSTSVEIAADVERSLQEQEPTAALAIYRIVEQALLNVAAHAGATHVRVSVLRSPDGYTLTVRDNGRGIDGASKRGLGTTLITTWVRSVHGTWSMRNADDGRGAVLSATIMTSAPAAVGSERG